MNRDSMIGWSLAALAVAAGYWQWGWRGLVLALTLVAFWLLLQFSRALRALRDAAAAPLGSVPSAVMLHAKLQVGMPMPQILRCAGSLGRKVGDEPETFEWRDASGATLRAELADGRLARWALERPAEGGEP